MRHAVTFNGANEIFGVIGIEIWADKEIGTYRANVNGVNIMRRTILSLCQAIVEELAKDKVES